MNECSPCPPSRSCGTTIIGILNSRHTATSSNNHLDSHQASNNNTASTCTLGGSSSPSSTCSSPFFSSSSSTACPFSSSSACSSPSAASGASSPSSSAGDPLQGQLVRGCLKFATTISSPTTTITTSTTSIPIGTDGTTTCTTPSNANNVNGNNAINTSSSTSYCTTTCSFYLPPYPSPSSSSVPVFPCSSTGPSPSSSPSSFPATTRPPSSPRCTLQFQRGVLQLQTPVAVRSAALPGGATDSVMASPPAPTDYSTPMPPQLLTCSSAVTGKVLCASPSTRPPSPLRPPPPPLRRSSLRSLRIGSPLPIIFPLVRSPHSTRSPSHRMPFLSHSVHGLQPLRSPHSACSARLVRSPHSVRSPQSVRSPLPAYSFNPIRFPPVGSPPFRSPPPVRSPVRPPSPIISPLVRSPPVYSSPVRSPPHRSPPVRSPPLVRSPSPFCSASPVSSPVSSPSVHSPIRSPHPVRPLSLAPFALPVWPLARSGFAPPAPRAPLSIPPTRALPPVPSSFRACPPSGDTTRLLSNREKDIVHFMRSMAPHDCRINWLWQFSKILQYNYPPPLKSHPFNMAGNRSAACNAALLCGKLPPQSACPAHSLSSTSHPAPSNYCSSSSSFSTSMSSIKMENSQPLSALIEEEEAAESGGAAREHQRLAWYLVRLLETYDRDVFMAELAKLRLEMSTQLHAVIPSQPKGEDEEDRVHQYYYYDNEGTLSCMDPVDEEMLAKNGSALWFSNCLLPLPSAQPVSNSSASPRWSIAQPSALVWQELETEDFASFVPPAYTGGRVGETDLLGEKLLGRKKRRSSVIPPVVLTADPVWWNKKRKVVGGTTRIPSAGTRTGRPVRLDGRIEGTADGVARDRSPIALVRRGAKLAGRAGVAAHPSFPMSSPVRDRPPQRLVAIKKRMGEVHVGGDGGSAVTGTTAGPSSVIVVRSTDRASQLYESKFADSIIPLNLVPEYFSADGEMYTQQIQTNTMVLPLPVGVIAAISCPLSTFHFLTLSSKGRCVCANCYAGASVPPTVQDVGGAYRRSIFSFSPPFSNASSPSLPRSFSPKPPTSPSSTGSPMSEPSLLLESPKLPQSCKVSHAVQGSSYVSSSSSSSSLSTSSNTVGRTARPRYYLTRCTAMRHRFNTTFNETHPANSLLSALLHFVSFGERIGRGGVGPCALSAAHDGRRLRRSGGHRSFGYEHAFPRFVCGSIDRRDVVRRKPAWFSYKLPPSYVKAARAPQVVNRQASRSPSPGSQRPCQQPLVPQPRLRSPSLEREGSEDEGGTRRNKRRVSATNLASPGSKKVKLSAGTGATSTATVSRKLTRQGRDADSSVGGLSKGGPIPFVNTGSSPDSTEAKTKNNIEWVLCETEEIRSDVAMRMWPDETPYMLPPYLYIGLPVQYAWRMSMKGVVAWWDGHVTALMIRSLKVTFTMSSTTSRTVVVSLYRFIPPRIPIIEPLGGCWRLRPPPVYRVLSTVSPSSTSSSRGVSSSTEDAESAGCPPVRCVGLREDTLWPGCVVCVSMEGNPYEMHDAVVRRVWTNYDDLPGDEAIAERTTTCLPCEGLCLPLHSQFYDCSNVNIHKFVQSTTTRFTSAPVVVVDLTSTPSRSPSPETRPCVSIPRSSAVASSYSSSSSSFNPSAFSSRSCSSPSTSSSGFSCSGATDRIRRSTALEKLASHREATRRAEEASRKADQDENHKSWNRGGSEARRRHAESEENMKKEDEAEDEGGDKRAVGCNNGTRDAPSRGRSHELCCTPRMCRNCRIKYDNNVDLLYADKVGGTTGSSTSFSKSGSTNNRAGSVGEVITVKNPSLIQQDSVCSVVRPSTTATTSTVHSSFTPSFYSLCGCPLRLVKVRLFYLGDDDVDECIDVSVVQYKLIYDIHPHTNRSETDTIEEASKVWVIPKSNQVVYNQILAKSLNGFYFNNYKYFTNDNSMTTSSSTAERTTMRIEKKASGNITRVGSTATDTTTSSANASDAKLTTSTISSESVIASSGIDPHLTASTVSIVGLRPSRSALSSGVATSSGRKPVFELRRLSGPMQRGRAQQTGTTDCSSGNNGSGNYIMKSSSSSNWTMTNGSPPFTTLTNGSPPFTTLSRQNVFIPVSNRGQAEIDSLIDAVGKAASPVLAPLDSTHQPQPCEESASNGNSSRIDASSNVGSTSNGGSTNISYYTLWYVPYGTVEALVDMPSLRNILHPELNWSDMDTVGRWRIIPPHHYTSYTDVVCNHTCNSNSASSTSRGGGTKSCSMSGTTSCHNTNTTTSNSTTSTAPKAGASGSRMVNIVSSSSSSSSCASSSSSRSNSQKNDHLKLDSIVRRKVGNLHVPTVTPADMPNRSYMASKANDSSSSIGGGASGDSVYLCIDITSDDDDDDDNCRSSGNDKKNVVTTNNTTSRSDNSNDRTTSRRRWSSGNSSRHSNTRKRQRG